MGIFLPRKGGRILSDRAVEETLLHARAENAHLTRELAESNERKDLWEEEIMNIRQVFPGGVEEAKRAKQALDAMGGNVPRILADCPLHTHTIACHRALVPEAFRPAPDWGTDSEGQED